MNAQIIAFLLGRSFLLIKRQAVSGWHSYSKDRKERTLEKGCAEALVHNFVAQALLATWRAENAQEKMVQGVRQAALNRLRMACLHFWLLEAHISRLILLFERDCLLRRVAALLQAWRRTAQLIKGRKNYVRYAYAAVHRVKVRASLHLWGEYSGMKGASKRTRVFMVIQRLVRRIRYASKDRLCHHMSAIWVSRIILAVIFAMQTSAFRTTSCVRDLQDSILFQMQVAIVFMLCIFMAGTDKF